MGTKRIVAVVAAVLMAATACNGEAAETTTTSTATTIAETTTTTRFQLVDGGLIGVDPATLIPETGAVPILVADRFRGVTSSNRRWTAIESMKETSVVVSVVDLDTGEVVSSGHPVAPADGLAVDDDGTAYWLGGTGLELIRLQNGADSALPVFQDFPIDFVAIGPLEILGAHRLGLFGIRDEDVDGSGEPTLLTVDTATETLAEFPLQEMGSMATDTGDPAIVWDVAKHRALIVEAARDVISELDLSSGEVTEHSYQPPTSREAAERTDRDAALSSDGRWLYVATLIGGSEHAADPEDLMVFDTNDWSVSGIDANVDSLYPSPDGSLLLAHGTSMTEAGDVRPSPVYVIEMAAATLQIAFQTTDESSTEVSYSRDGTLAYLTTWPESGMKIDVLDLGSMQLTGAVGFPRLSFIGEAGLLAFHLE